ncbi:MAG TPA: zinc ribbon domain-containing protein [Phycisphaerales bacterium]|nr:zinc ribbon domain-containing protein [Phycisphaerales bacterium]
MPTYVYQLLNPDGSDFTGPDSTFEVIQKMSDPALTHHPQTKKPCRRVILAPNVAGDWSDAGAKNKLSDKNLDRLGFTKYQKVGGGTYEKTAGSGPDTISAD